MSDEPRGPYTPSREGPPRDAPLQFDARRARDARPMPMTLIASGVVLVVLIGGVIMAYTGGFHHKDDPDKPVGDRVLVMKTPPAPGASTSEQVVTPPRSDAAAPTFAAPPEEPAPRPKPQLQLRSQTLPPVRIASGDETPSSAVASGAKPSAPTSTLLPTTRAATPAKAKSVETASTETTPAKAATAKVTPAAKSTVIPKAKTATASTATGSAGVQIGAFSSRELAEQGVLDVGKLVPTTGHGRRIEAVERGGSTLYRTTITGFADRDAAKAFCASLSAKGHACIVKG